MKKNILSLFVLLIFMAVSFVGCTQPVDQVLESAETVAKEVTVNNKAAGPWEFGLLTQSIVTRSDLKGFCATTADAWVKDVDNDWYMWDETFNGNGFWSANSTFPGDVITMDLAYSGLTPVRFELRNRGSIYNIYKNGVYYSSAPANTVDIAAAICAGGEYIYAITSDFKLYMESSKRKGYWYLLSDTEYYTNAITCTVGGDNIRLVKFMGYYANTFYYVNIGTVGSSYFSVSENSNGEIAWQSMGRFTYKTTSGGSSITVIPSYLVAVGLNTIDCITYGGAILRTGIDSVNGYTFDFSNAVNGIYCYPQPN